MNRCLALVVFGVATANGQVATPSGQSVSMLGTSQAATAQSTSPVAITFEHKTLQTLGDGTHITRTTHEWFFRDSQGRTRTENELNNSPNTQAAIMRNVVVRDPASGKTIAWTIGPGVAKMYTVIQLRRAGEPVPAGTNPVPATANPGLRMAPPPVQVPPPPPPQQVAVRAINSRDVLGMQDVLGAPCAASRYTTVYPVDMLGNDRPITVVHEMCMSQEFGRVLSDRQDDPRTGLRTLTVTSLTRTEPDPSLFQPPPDFTERPQVNRTLPPAQ
jgi:hypothetical protein